MLILQQNLELIDLDDGTVNTPSKPRQPEPNPFTGSMSFSFFLSSN